MKGELAAECYIHGVTELDLQRERDEILATDQKDIAALGALVTACMQENNLCVLGSENKIKENATVFGQLKTIFD
jgi:Zn-dependent M16 (insulinase) family peptidase